jgi:dienelactone hydrolase
MKTPFTLEDAPHAPLHGDVIRPDDALGAPVVVGLHGFKGFKDWGFWPEIGRRFADAGLTLVTFNVSGSGVEGDADRFTDLEGFARNTISRELDDVGRVLEAVASRELPLGGSDVRRIGLLGHSRGGGVALLRAARDRRVGSVVTWNAVSHFCRFDDETVARWREEGFTSIPNARTGQILRLDASFLEDLDAHGDALVPAIAARRLEAPLLVVHGTRDETIPVEDAERITKAAPPGVAQSALIPGGTHTFGAAHPFVGVTPELELALERTVAWFRETLVPTPA